MKQVCVKARVCSITRSTTCGALLPTLATAMPEARSISELPSASTRTPPPAASTNTGEAPAPGGLYKHRRGGAHARRDVPRAARQLLQRPGSGDGGDEAALLGE